MRAKELRDGLGWPIDAKRYADLRGDHPSLAATANVRQEEQSNFYDTEEPPGPRRLVQMLRESSWWSERLARLAFRLSLGLVIVLGVTSLYAISFADLLRGGPLTRAQLVSLNTSLICLVFSGNLAWLVVGYSALRDAASATYERLDALAAQAVPTQAAVLSAVMSYQFARAAAPPVPDWVWRLRRAVLNETWREELSKRGQTQ